MEGIVVVQELLFAIIWPAAQVPLATVPLISPASWILNFRRVRKRTTRVTATCPFQTAGGDSRASASWALRKVREDWTGVVRPGVPERSDLAARRDGRCQLTGVGYAIYEVIARHRGKVD